jgi:hypothetical protein
VFAIALLAGSRAAAQSPELSLREFASGQIKKGVRSIGFGGDGATWGNYSLVYRDAGTALVDGGVTAYDNGNHFLFTAVGVTTPKLWHGLAIYAIALAQNGSGVRAFGVTVPSLSGMPLTLRGDGSNQAIFIKAALPLAHGFSFGFLLSYEVSQFDAMVDGSAAQAVRWETRWRPSGGAGLTWQPHPRVLLGTRVILNHDEERRIAPGSVVDGLNRSYEFRLGASFSPWKGALLDAGATLLDRNNAIAAQDAAALGKSYSDVVKIGPNVGFEQAFLDRTIALRVGLDEETIGAGFSVKIRPVNLDVAYLYNLASERVGTLFGAQSNSVLATLTLDYAALAGK